MNTKPIKNNKNSIINSLSVKVTISLILILGSPQILLAKASSPSESRFSFMTYNVENLFDTSLDEGKNDHTYQPAKSKKTQTHIDLCLKIKRKEWRDECLYLDWNKAVLHQKLSQLAKVIMIKNPDILVLQEVENDAVLQLLQKKYLKKAKYTTRVLIEGDDKRGIDTALLSRFDWVKPATLHNVRYKNISDDQLRDTRGILEVELVLPTHETITIYANHFPAPYSPKAFRIQGFEMLIQLQSRNPSRLQIAAGDFNVTSEEDRKHQIIKEYVHPHWLVAHELCQVCKGTYYYKPKKNWSFLDMILVSKNHLSPWRMDEKTVEVVQKDWMKDNEGGAKPFNPKNGTGASDHFPLYVEFVKK